MTSVNIDTTWSGLSLPAANSGTAVTETHDSCAQPHVVVAHHRAVDQLAGPQRARRRQVGLLDRDAMFVEHQPAPGTEQFLLHRQAAFHVGHADRRGIGIDDAAIGVVGDDALVDPLQQFAIARLDFLAAAQVARDRDDRWLAVVFEVGRMHFHREAGAVGAHVGDFDHIGAAAAQCFADRPQVVAWQVRIEHVDRLADDLFARPLVRGHAGLVEVEHGAVPGEHADRIGHGIEQGAVTVALGFGRGARGEQGVVRLLQHRPRCVRQRGVIAGLLQRRQCRRDVRGRERVGRRRFRGHAAANALVTLLPLSRPRRAASQRPVSTSLSRSMPVSMPRPCSM